jgi:hypothetical protein
VPKTARGDFTRWNRKAGEGPLKNILSEKPLWTALCGLWRKTTLSQLGAFFKLILFFQTIPCNSEKHGLLLPRFFC